MKEIRKYELRPEIRAEEGAESRKVEGYALLFNSRSVDLGGFTEVIAPGALDGVLERSDVLALMNHDPGRGVLARSRRGEGSLELTVDEKGLRYSFEAPNTALGDELLEGIRRGDISQSSFAFLVGEDRWEKTADGAQRTILRFEELFDVSPVYHPAYEETTVDLRGLEALNAGGGGEAPEPSTSGEPSHSKTDADEERNADEEEKEPDEEEKKPDEKPDEEEGQEQDSTDEPEGDADEEDESEDEDDKRNTITNLHIQKRMGKREFSLLGAIRAVVDKRNFDEGTARLINEGRAAIEACGVSTSGQIVLPFERRDAEKRFEDNPQSIIASQNEEAQGYGGEAVPTELFDIIGPLMDRLIVTQLGARQLTLTGNVEIPLYDGAQCTWESETAPAKKTGGKFKKLKLSPKRITAYLPISKQWLIQTSPTAENTVRQNLIDSIGLKLQQTMFGSGAGDDVTPAGLFKGVSADSAEFTYKDAVDMEMKLEEGNVFGEMKYVASPSAKAILRNTKIDAGSGRFVMESNEILGVPTLSTGSVVRNGLILGDWSNLYIASFGGLDLTVDNITLAGQAQIQLIVNAWFDYLPVREEAFVKRILK